MSEKREIDVIVPGTMLREESYRDHKDHPDYARYLQANPDWVKTSEIMDHWTKQPIMSEGFASCYPLIAVKPNKSAAQAVHVSRDPLRPTPKHDLSDKLAEWKQEQDGILLVRGEQSSIVPEEIFRLQASLGEQLHPIELHSHSRFGIVYDVEKRILLVQLTDDQILRVYQGI